MRRYEQYRNDKVIKHFHDQMARLYNIATIARAEIIDGQFRIILAEPFETKLAEMRTQLNTYIMETYSDLLTDSHERS